MGRGDWYRWDSKTTTESQHRVDIRYMKKRGFLKPGSSGTLTWSRGGERTGWISYRAEEELVTLIYNYRKNGGEWESIEERIALDKTPCNYGGFRRWFLCPHCSKRVALLYGAGRRFLCRHCYGLTYASQQENQADRFMRKARSIRTRLGGDDSLMEPFPEKPKRMHWQTYWRLQREAGELENMGWASIAQRIGMEI